MAENFRFLIKEKFLSIKEKTPGLATVFTFFSVAGFNTRVVGGCVRNLLLDYPIADFDLTTDALPSQIVSILKEHHIQYFTPGIAHGTIIFIFNHIQYEITTLRKDLECDGRHASVEFTTSFAEDALRRDLTINAMSIDVDGNLYDYFNGLADLQKGLIRFVGDPEKRISEDYLRILRFYRFYSYYGVIIDEHSHNACKQNGENIKTLSVERVWQEFSKILIAPQAIKTLKIMAEDKVLKFIISESFLNYELLQEVIKICDKNEIKQKPIRNYFCLTYGSNLPHKLILSKKDKFYLAHFNKNFSSTSDLEKNIDRILYLYGKDLVVEQILLQAAIKKQEIDINLIAKLKKAEIPVFPIQSLDIISKFDLQGETLGKMLKAIKEIWLNSNCKLTREKLLKEADEEFKRNYSKY